jgi:hypothetical protein
MESHKLTLEAIKAELDQMGYNWKDRTVTKIDLLSLEILLG